MGYVVNSASLLADLFTASKEPYRVLDEVRDALRRFRLLAFVLHDPRQHGDLERVLRARFVRFDRDTGRDLLFLTIADAKPTGGYDGRNYVRELSSYAELSAQRFAERTRLGYAVPGPVGWPDERKAIDAFLLEFGVAGYELPCVIVTDGAEARDAWMFRTSAGRIAEQLTMLATMARALVGSDLLQGRGTLQLEPATFERVGFADGHVRRLPLSTQFGKAASDAVTLGGRDHHVGMRGPPQCAEDIAHERRAEYEQLRDGSPVERGVQRSARLDEAADRMTRALVAARGSPYRDAAARLVAELDGKLEREVVAAVETALVLLEIGAQDDVWLPHAIRSFGCAFEAELNLSVVQWMRGGRGVDLPTYFARYQPGVRALVQDVELNAQRARRWLPPGLGQSHRVVGDFQGPPSPWEGATWAAFYARWGEVFRIRNRHGHGHDGQPVAEVHEDARRIRSLLGEFLRDGDFDRLLGLKLDCGRDAWADAERGTDGRAVREMLEAEAVGAKSIADEGVRRKADVRERAERRKAEAREQVEKEARERADRDARCAALLNASDFEVASFLRALANESAADQRLVHRVAQQAAEGKGDALTAWMRGATDPTLLELYTELFKETTLGAPFDAWVTHDGVTGAPLNLHLRSPLGRRIQRYARNANCDPDLLARLGRASAGNPCAIVAVLWGKNVQVRPRP